MSGSAVGPLSPVIAYYAVYVKFVGLVSIMLFRLGKRCSCCMVDTGETSRYIKDGGTMKYLLWL